MSIFFYKYIIGQTLFVAELQYDLYSECLMNNLSSSSSSDKSSYSFNNLLNLSFFDINILIVV